MASTPWTWSGASCPCTGGARSGDTSNGSPEFLAAHRADPAMAEFTAPLERAGRRSRGGHAVDSGTRRARDPEEIGAASYDYLRLMGLTALGHMWARSAGVALNQVNGDNSGFYEAKLATARFFMKRLLPATGSLKRTLSAGADALMTMDAEAF